MPQINLRSQFLFLFDHSNFDLSFSLRYLFIFSVDDLDFKSNATLTLLIVARALSSCRLKTTHSSRSCGMKEFFFSMSIFCCCLYKYQLDWLHGLRADISFSHLPSFTSTPLLGSFSSSLVTLLYFFFLLFFAQIDDASRILPSVFFLPFTPIYNLVAWVHDPKQIANSNNERNVLAFSFSYIHFERK